MRKKLLIGALSLLGIILILVIAAIWYVRSGRLDLLLKAQIVEALKDMGIRAEISDAKLDIFGDKVTLTGIDLYPEDSQNRFGQVDKIEANFSVISYLKQEVNITEVIVDHPQFWLEFDEAGRSVIDSFREPPKSEAEKAGITFFTANFIVNHAAIEYKDRKRNIVAILPDVDITFSAKEPAALEDKINHTLVATFNENARAEYQGRLVENIDLDVKADVTTEKRYY